MAGRKAELDTWEALWQRIGFFSGALSRYKAKNVNASGLRNEARAIVRSYSQEGRASLQRLGVNSKNLAELDSEMQRLSGLTTGKNSRASYQKTLAGMRKTHKEIETDLEFLIGVEAPAKQRVEVGNVEKLIMRTLETMIPSAALSYEQMLIDLQDGQQLRRSYRGTAAELREVVREVLDHLAPDDAVMNSSGFKLEPGLKGPTMKQKVRFILRARKSLDAARQTAEDAAQHLDENIASLGRSVYTRGSVGLHTSRSRQEVLNFKGYADAVLGELLEIHKPTNTNPSGA